MDSLNVLIKTILQMPNDADINNIKRELQTKLGNININTNNKGLKLLDTNEIDLYQRKMKNMLANLSIGKDNILASPAIKKDLNTFLSDLSKVGTVGSKSTKELGVQFSELNTKVRKSAYEMSLLRKDTDSFSTTLVKNTGKMLQWGIAGTAIYGSLRNIKLGISYIFDLDNAMNEVRIVTNKTQEEVERLADSYNRLAKEMNVTTRELAQTSADLYRQGLNDTQVEERMKGIIEYAKISSISLDQSNKIITATANATGESIQKIIDIFALLGDTTASGADEIGIALQRVASAAENSNISLEKSASWIATISSITRESASTIGRSLDFGAIAA